MKTKIVIFGANGMLGSSCYNYLNSLREYNIVKHTREDFDVLKDHPDKLSQLANTWWDNETKEVYVINAIGLIPQRVRLTNTTNYIKLNAIFPYQLNQTCKSKNATMIHITTDCVYNGLDGPYAEGAQPNETSIYGASKSCGEPDDAMIIRTSIIGEETVHPGVSLLEWVRSQPTGNKIQGYTNHFWNGLTCHQVAKIIHDCIQNKITWKGVRHITSPDVVSKYELVTMIKEIYELDLEIQPHATEKSINKVLLPSKYAYIGELSENIPPIKKQIEELKAFKPEN